MGVSCILSACVFLLSCCINSYAFTPTPIKSIAYLAVPTNQHSSSIAPPLHMAGDCSVLQALPTTTIVDFPSWPSFLMSMGNGVIDWNNPVEAVVGGITLVYFAFSIWAGVKYFIKDGWRPKL